MNAMRPQDEEEAVPSAIDEAASAETMHASEPEPVPEPEEVPSAPADTLVSADTYDALFLIPWSDPETRVDSEVWDLIRAALPPAYVLPNPATLLLFQPMTGDHYNRIFANPLPTPAIIVDDQIWKALLAALPADYVLPDPAIIDLLA